MVNAIDNRLALSHQTGNHQTGRGAQIRRHDGGAREFFNALHDGDLALDLDFGAQAHHLVDVHETVFKNRLGHHASAVRHRIERHELRLHVGRETRIFGGAKRLRLHAAAGLNADEALARRDDGAGLAQLFNHRIQVIGAAVAQHHVAARCRNGTQKGAGLNAVGHYLVVAAMQAINALNMDAACAVAFDLRAHGNQHLGQVANLGLLRGVFKNRLALGQSGGHQEVFSAGDSHHVSGDVRALEASALAVSAGRHLRQHVAVLDRDVRAHGLQALDVLIHRP